MWANIISISSSIPSQHLKTDPRVPCRVWANIPFLQLFQNDMFWIPLNLPSGCFTPPQVHLPLPLMMGDAQGWPETPGMAWHGREQGPLPSCTLFTHSQGHPQLHQLLFTPVSLNLHLSPVGFPAVLRHEVQPEALCIWEKLKGQGYLGVWAWWSHS